MEVSEIQTLMGYRSVVLLEDKAKNKGKTIIGVERDLVERYSRGVVILASPNSKLKLGNKVIYNKYASLCDDFTHNGEKCIMIDDVNVMYVEDEQ